jgi:hypothetical protein
MTLESNIFTTFIYFGGDLNQVDFAIFLSELFSYNVKRNETLNSNLSVLEKMCLDIVQNPYLQRS